MRAHWLSGGVVLAILVLNSPRLTAEELTGVYRKAVGMTQPAHLEIDGPGLVSKIEVDESSLKGAQDGQHLWVDGEIRTYLQGSPEQEKLQQQPTQWIVKLNVRKWKPIKARFERPERETAQDKPSEATWGCFVVLSGSKSAVTKGDCIRVTSEEEWATVWNRHAGTQRESATGSDVPQMPAIDFARCMVIAVFLGATVNTAGLEVVSSSNQGGEITVGVDLCMYQSMGDGDKVTPFAFLVLPRSVKPILLQVDTRGLQERADRLPPIWKQLFRFPKLQK